MWHWDDPQQGFALDSWQQLILRHSKGLRVFGSNFSLLLQNPLKRSLRERTDNHSKNLARIGESRTIFHCTLRKFGKLKINFIIFFISYLFYVKILQNWSVDTFSVQDNIVVMTFHNNWKHNEKNNVIAKIHVDLITLCFRMIKTKIAFSVFIAFTGVLPYEVVLMLNVYH
jgi:hypothetical protein